MYKSLSVALILSIIALACAPSESFDEDGNSGGAPVTETPPRVDETLPIDPAAEWKRWPAVYRDYGPLIAKAEKREKEMITKPWSDWWYPLRSTHLFQPNGREPSPLQKYDQYVRSVYGVDSHSAEYEEKSVHKPDAENWEGLCHAWAIAAVLHPEPVKKIKASGIEFSISDQKAILVKTYEQSVNHYYGQKYNAAGAGSIEWSSIQPHLFHRFVLGEFFERGKPFVMNKVPGMEMWNLPIFKVATQMEADPAEAGVYHVTTSLTGAGVLENPSDKPELKPDVTVYTYDLITKKDQHGRDFVVFGKWTGASTQMHPSILIVAPRRGAGHQSMNPWIENDVVKAILAARNDPPT